MNANLAAARTEEPLEPSDPRAVRGWLSTLDGPDPARSAPAVRDALERLGRQSLTPALRLDLLWAYGEHAGRLVDASARPDAAGAPEDRAATAGDLAAVLSHLQAGFSAVLVAGERQDGPGSDFPWAGAVYGAMEQTIRSTVHAYRSGRPLVPGAQRELHRLYALAERYEALDAAVGPRRKGDSERTVTRLFLTALLFQICDPFSFSDAELPVALRVLARYAPRCRVSAERLDPSGPIVVIDLAGNAGPTLPALTARSAHPRYVDLSGALEALERDRRAAAETPRERARTEWAKRLRERLRRGLEPGGLEHGRGPGARELVVRAAIGLDTVHHFLDGVSERLRAALEDSARPAASAAQEPHRLVSWLLSEDPGRGYRLRQAAPEAIDAEVGELVGLIIADADPEADLRLDLGLVTWRRLDAQDRLRLGVRPLAQGAAAAHCTNASGRRRGEPRDAPEGSGGPCLYVARERTALGVALLLASAQTDWENRQIVVELGPSTKLVKVGRRREDVTALACYELPGRRRPAAAG